MANIIDALTGVDPDRDAMELACFRLQRNPAYLFLEFAVGFQVVNVALGGTLYTHIQDQFPGALKHDYDSGSQRQFLAHEVDVEKISQLAGILGETRLK